MILEVVLIKWKLRALFDACNLLCRFVFEDQIEFIKAEVTDAVNVCTDYPMYDIMSSGVSSSLLI